MSDGRNNSDEDVVDDLFGGDNMDVDDEEDSNYEVEDLDIEEADGGTVKGKGGRKRING